MGSYAGAPEWDEFHEDDDSSVALGELLSGRLADVEVDSVTAVREQRE